jgi:Sulfatase-modifying factor enzyme 1
LPELSLSTVGDLYLKGRPQVIADAPSTVPLAQPTSEAAQAWAAMQGTTSQAVPEDFIKRYGESFYGTLARARLEELKKSQVAVAAPPVVPVALTVSSSLCSGNAVSVSLTARAPCPLSPTEERSLKPKDVFKEYEKCPEMVVVPPGTFTSAGEEDASPKHIVTISETFAAGRLMVTIDQFADFVKETGYVASSKCFTGEQGKWQERSDRSFRNPGSPQAGSSPAVCLNWKDAKAYVAWLSRKTQKPYRLLTDAEWEHAAKAGKATPLESFAPNEFGRYAIRGRVAHLVEDRPHATVGPSDALDCAWRVVRGSGGSLQRSINLPDGTPSDYDGFRVARTLTP